jgi:probable phosphoglycerate mutase
MGELILIRHSETAWSRSGQHTGRTDVPLTDSGLADAIRLAPSLAALPITAAFTSPASRARDTAKAAGLPDAVVDADLQEWDYGGYEGRTTAQITADRPGWNLWRDGVVPGDAGHPGETIEQVGRRADAVLDRVTPLLPGGDVALFAHGHLIRVLTARWLGLPPAAGRLFGHPGAGTLCLLGSEHAEPVISSWNLPAADAG